MKPPPIDKPEAQGMPSTSTVGGEPRNAMPAPTAANASTNDVAHWKQECERLTAALKKVEKERDDYLQSLYYYLKKECIPEPEADWERAMEERTAGSIMEVLARVDQEQNKAKRP